MAPKVDAVNVGSELVRNSFINADQEIRDTVELVRFAGLEFCLSEPTAIFPKEVLDFYTNAVLHPSGESLTTLVNGHEVAVSPASLSLVLHLPVHEVEDDVTDEVVESCREWCAYTAGGHIVERMKLNARGKFLADIVGKALICKPTSHDRISREMFKLMAGIVGKLKRNWGVVIFKRISGNLKEPNFGRILSLFLRLSMGEQLKGCTPVSLHHGKRLDMKLFSRWERTISKKRPAAEETGTGGEEASTSQPPLHEPIPEPIPEQFSFPSPPAEPPLPIPTASTSAPSREPSPALESTPPSTSYPQLSRREAAAIATPHVFRRQRRRSAVEGECDTLVSTPETPSGGVSASPATTQADIAAILEAEEQRMLQDLSDLPTPSTELPTPSPTPSFVAPIPSSPASPELDDAASFGDFVSGHDEDLPESSPHREPAVEQPVSPVRVPPTEPAMSPTAVQEMLDQHRQSIITIVEKYKEDVDFNFRELRNEMQATVGRMTFLLNKLLDKVDSFANKADVAGAQVISLSTAVDAVKENMQEYQKETLDKLYFLKEHMEEGINYAVNTLRPHVAEEVRKGENSMVDIVCTKLDDVSDFISANMHWVHREMCHRYNMQGHTFPPEPLPEMPRPVDPSCPASAPSSSAQPVPEPEPVYPASEPFYEPESPIPQKRAEIPLDYDVHEKKIEEWRIKEAEREKRRIADLADPNFEVWSPKSRSIILNTWRDFKEGKVHETVYSREELKKQRNSSDYRKAFISLQKVFNPKTGRTELPKIMKPAPRAYIPKPIAYFERQKEKAAEKKAKEDKAEARRKDKGIAIKD